MIFILYLEQNLNTNCLYLFILFNSYWSAIFYVRYPHIFYGYNCIWNKYLPIAVYVNIKCVQLENVKELKVSQPNYRLLA